jgi:mannosyltransferase OCH1-like enzyme
MNFPKNIFQTWKTKNVPDNWKEAQQSVIQKNPNWNYILLTDDDNDRIVKENFPDFYQTFISFKYPIQRADVIRYCVLYLYGGIYLDLDYICNKSFDDLSLQKEVGLVYSNNIKIFTNSVLISQKSSEFWLKCIEQTKKLLPWYKKITKHFEIYNSTGPMMINNIANKNMNYVQIFTNIYVPCNTCNINVNSCVQNNEYYLTPIQGQTWNSWDTLLLNKIYCNKNTVLLIIIILTIIIYKLIKSKK